MSRTRPTPSKFSAMMRPSLKLSVFAAPASAARSLRSSAIANAFSLKGAVTFMPLPPAAKNDSTVAAKASSGSSGPSIAVYEMS